MSGVETFPELSAVRAAFLTRAPDIDVAVEREEALRRLAPEQERLRAAAGFATPLVTAEQVHGNAVAVVDSGTISPVAGVDGLVTTDPSVTLGIYVADCAAIYLADRAGRGIALVHSGRKGTDLAIASRAVETLCATAQIVPADLIAVISPCIRPPHYEVDFAATIREQLWEAGLTAIHDSGRCTASHPASYYSYRRELGKTGRMLALLQILKK